MTLRAMARKKKIPRESAMQGTKAHNPAASTAEAAVGAAQEQLKNVEAPGLAPGAFAAGQQALPLPLPPFPTPFAHLFNNIERSVGQGAARIQTLHEMRIAALEGAICDKPGWWEKIFDPVIIKKWRAESVTLLADMMEDSPEVFDFALAELRWNATQWPGPSRVSAVEGVFAADGLLTEF